MDATLDDLLRNAAIIVASSCNNYNLLVWISTIHVHSHTLSYITSAIHTSKTILDFPLISIFINECRGVQATYNSSPRQESVDSWQRHRCKNSEWEKYRKENIPQSHVTTKGEKGDNHCCKTQLNVMVNKDTLHRLQRSGNKLLLRNSISCKF